jgi:hypothetical protein
MFPSSDEGEGYACPVRSLRKKVGVSLPLPEGGIIQFQKRFLVFRNPDEGQRSETQ